MRPNDIPVLEGDILDWLDAWDAGVSYEVADIVAYNHHAYQCTVANTGVLPTNSSYWVETLLGQGAVGPAGPPGPPGDTINYVHTQSMPSADWDIVHNLGAFPAGIAVVDSGGENWIGRVEYIDDNELILHFSASFGGTAYLS